MISWKGLSDFLTLWIFSYVELQGIPWIPQLSVPKQYGNRESTTENNLKNREMSSINNKRQRFVSEYSLATLSAVAAATSIAELNSKIENAPTTLPPPESETMNIETKSGSKEDKNELHPMYGVQPFIAKLYQMINTCDRDTPSIASWDDNGQTFVVKDTKAFASEIMPNYMQTKQFDSFIRNLNFYDFHKIHALPIPKSDRDPGAAKHVKYRHPNFQRNKMDLVREIKRSTRKVRNAAAQQEKEVEQIKNHVKELQETIQDMARKFQVEMNMMKEKVNRLENMVQQKSFHSSSNGTKSMPEERIISNVGDSINDKESSSTFNDNTMCRSVSTESTHNATLPTAISLHQEGSKPTSNNAKAQSFSSACTAAVESVAVGIKRDREGNPTQDGLNDKCKMQF